jgi:CRISPR-associated protein Cas1
MRKLLNTLFVTTQGSYLSCEGENILVKVDGETKLRVPVHTLDGVVCFGRVSCSPPVMRLCGESGVLITFLSENGRFLARVHGRVSGNVLLRREQYRRAETEDRCTEIALPIVRAKVFNCRVVLRRFIRDNPGHPRVGAIEIVVAELASVLRALQKCNGLEASRGFEGQAARAYFSVFDDLILQQKDAFYFRERSRRPPLDNMNSALSFVYTLLTHDVVSALESVGLDPAVGYLHKERPGRPSLALDLVEEFRPFIADRLVLSLVNRQQLSAKGFVATDSGAIMMSDETRKTVLVAYQKRKQEELRHPFLDEKVKVGLLPFTQALLLSRFLRGDIDGYPPFIWR